MTIRTKPRGGRALAAVLAAMLVASVLAVVAGSPAQAANTAKQALLDTDDDGVGDTREFGGDDRYHTAALLAENFVKYQGGVGTAPAVLLASGESLVDAVAVSGYAGELGAPVLLTGPDALHPRAASFIEDYGVKTVWVLGGKAAVADSVLDEIEALRGRPVADRIQGADRYETAAKIADKQADVAYWCSSTESSAVIVNGQNGMLAEAMIIAPIANRLRLPVLLTATDELPEATADYLRRNSIEHVQIIGGVSSVSEDVAKAVSALGVGTVLRTGGADSAATSVEVAKLLTDDGCKDALAPASTNFVAVANRDAPPDGVSAGPVLATSYDSASLVPLLLVSSSLPASVGEWLGETPKATSGGAKTELRILAIGGTAAVSASVMDAALRAAAPGPKLTVTISSVTDHNGNGSFDDAPQAGETSFRLNFSDNINGADPKLRAKLLDVVRIARAPLALASSDPIRYGAGDTNTSACDPDSVTIKLQSALRGGESITVASTPLTFGANEDMRPLAGTQRTVESTNPPVVGIPRGVIGDNKFFVTVTDDDGFSKDETFSLTSPEDITAAKRTDNSAFSIATVTPNLVGQGITTVKERTFTLTLTAGQKLKTGDTITINEGAIVDIAGKRSAATTTVDLDPAVASIELEFVRVSSQVDSGQAKFVVPKQITGGDGEEVKVGSTADTADMFFTAKKLSAADGIDGNDWDFHFRPASTYNKAKAKGKALDVDVYVDTTNKRVFITFNDGEGKFSDLRAILEADTNFSALWEVSVDPKTNDNHCVKADNSLDLPEAEYIAADTLAADKGGSKGSVMMAIEAEFKTAGDGKYPVKEVYTRNLLDDILADTLTRLNVGGGSPSDAAAWRGKADVTGLWADNSSTDQIAATALTVPTGNNNDPTNIQDGPLEVVTYVVRVTDASYLPRSGDSVMVVAGTSVVTAIAQGYGTTQWNKPTDDPATTTTVEKVTIGTGATAPTPPRS